MAVFELHEQYKKAVAHLAMRQCGENIVLLTLNFLREGFDTWPISC